MKREILLSKLSNLIKNSLDYWKEMANQEKLLFIGNKEKKKNKSLINNSNMVLIFGVGILIALNAFLLSSKKHSISIRVEICSLKLGIATLFSEK